MKKKILFRADGNAAMGLGHLYRLFAFVEMVRQQYECTFLTRNNSLTSVIPSNYELVLVPEHIDISEEPQWLANHFQPTKNLLILDGYQFNSAYQKLLKQAGFKMIYVDDLAKEYMFADVVINHSISVAEKDFKGEYYTRYALGSNFGILRPGFIEKARHLRKIVPPYKAFVCFGGSDPFELSLFASEVLLEVPKIAEVHVVIGAAYRGKKIFEFFQKQHEHMKLHWNLEEAALISLMEHCNLAIVPTSTICYEACCLKMLIIGGYFADNQKAIYCGLKEFGAIYPAGDFRNLTSAAMKEIIETLVQDTDRQRWYQQKQALLFDGKVNYRMNQLIKSLC